MGGFCLETKQKQQSRPIWLTWITRVILGYVSLLALILAATIIVILVTFSFVMLDGVMEARSLGAYAEKHLVPISEFLWKLFTWLMPGI
jgi:hypothetical protein